MPPTASHRSPSRPEEAQAEQDGRSDAPEERALHVRLWGGIGLEDQLKDKPGGAQNGWATQSSEAFAALQRNARWNPFNKQMPGGD